MSVQTELDRIIGAVEAAHLKVTEKGGTTARPYLVGNLESAIDSIPQGSTEDLDSEIATQKQLIADIQTALEGKAAGGGGVEYTDVDISKTYGGALTVTKMRFYAVGYNTETKEWGPSVTNYVPSAEMGELIYPTVKGTHILIVNTDDTAHPITAINVSEGLSVLYNNAKCASIAVAKDCPATATLQVVNG